MMLSVELVPQSPSRGMGQASGGKGRGGSWHDGLELVGWNSQRVVPKGAQAQERQVRNQVWGQRQLPEYCPHTCARLALSCVPTQEDGEFSGLAGKGCDGLVVPASSTEGA